jgi:hypothetical protein
MLIRSRLHCVIFKIIDQKNLTVVFNPIYKTITTNTKTKIDFIEDIVAHLGTEIIAPNWINQD